MIAGANGSYEAPMADFQALSPNLMTQISATLAGLVQDMLGPCGQQTLLSTSTGKVQVTRDGMTILLSLHLAHPVARFITQSLRSYHLLHQDGTKTFILYLSNILKVAARFVEVQGNCEHGKLSRTRLSLELNRFLGVDFELILKLFWKKLHYFTSKESDLALNCRKVLRASLCTSVQNNLVEFVTDFLLSFLGLNHNKSDLKQSLYHLLENFDMYHIKVPNQPQQKSTVYDGILLETDLQIICRTGEKGTIIGTENKKFVMMEIDFDLNRKQDGGQVFTQLSSERMVEFLSYKRRSWKLILLSLKEANVDVLLCAETVPKFVASMCIEEGILLRCLPSETLAFLEYVTGVPVLKDVNEEALSEHIFTASIISTVHVGRRVCTVIQPDQSTKRPPCAHVSHMVVCAPTEGMCDQLCTSLFKALKALHASLTHTVLPGSLTSKCCVAAKGDCSLTTGPTQPNSNEPTVLAIKSGCCFEVILSSAITEHYASQSSRQGQEVGVFIQQMLMGVARTLHANLTSARLGCERSFTEKWTWMQSLAFQGKLAGLDIHGQVCDSEAALTPYLEPVSTKLSLVVAVVQLAAQLLRVEAVIPVKRICSDGGSDEECDDDKHG